MKGMKKTKKGWSQSSREAYTYIDKWGHFHTRFRDIKLDNLFKANYADLKLLGLSINATIEAVKQAYRRLALQHHPDMGGDPDEMARINLAYKRVMEVLKK